MVVNITALTRMEDSNAVVEAGILFMQMERAAMVSIVK